MPKNRGASKVKEDRRMMSLPESKETMPPVGSLAAGANDREIKEMLSPFWAWRALEK